MTISAKPEELRSERLSPKSRHFRQKIVNVALKHFSLYGLEGTSIRQIAQDAKTTHTLILYHFDSKEKLWAATMEATVGRYIRSIKKLLKHEPDAPPAPILEQFIDRFVHMSADKPEIHRILTMASTQETERVQWLVDSLLRDHFEFIVALIRRGQLDGTVRQCDPVRLYYHIIGSAGTMFTLSGEFKALTGRNVFSKTEIYQTIAFIYDVVFTDNNR